jgi:hypothetical protein
MTQDDDPTIDGSDPVRIVRGGRTTVKIRLLLDEDAVDYDRLHDADVTELVIRRLIEDNYVAFFRLLAPGEGDPAGLLCQLL